MHGACRIGSQLKNVIVRAIAFECCSVPGLLIVNSPTTSFHGLLSRFGNFGVWGPCAVFIRVGRSKCRSEGLHHARVHLLPALPGLKAHRATSQEAAGLLPNL